MALIMRARATQSGNGKNTARASYELAGSARIPALPRSHQPNSDWRSFRLARLRRSKNLFAGRIWAYWGVCRDRMWIPDDGDQDSETMSIKITK